MAYNLHGRWRVAGGAELAIAVLGAPRIERDGAVVTFDTRKAIALLAYLAVTARPQRRETLAALLWPDADDTRARSALRRTLSVVRRELGDLGPSISREEVELVDAGAVTIDVRSFLAGAASDDLDDVAAATALWRGELLAGFTLRDSPGFDDWQSREAERLRRVMSSACARVVDARATRGELDDAITYAERWLDLDPLHEPAHRALMRLHAQRGDRAAAVHQYRQCIRTVDEELGVAPLAETTALYEAISAGDVGLSGATPIEPPKEAVLGRYPLTGRHEELAQLLAAVGPGRAIVVEGEPGVGKTRLVEEVLARQDDPALLARCYDNDVPYGPLVELLRLAAARPASARALASLPPSITAEAARLVPELGPIDVENPASLEGPGAETRFLDGLARAVGAAGSAPPGLLVVDDAQWADDATQQVLAHLLHRGGDDAPCLLVTQRSGEVGDSGPLSRALADRLRDGNGVTIRLGRLSARSVSALVAGRVPDDDAARVSEEVIRESEGLPFLVVAYLDALAGGGAAPADVGDLLRSRLDSLTDGAAQLLTTASVIGRSFTFDILRAASGRSEDEAVTGLDELVARGLVEERATPDEPTYDFTHGQVRQLVYDQTSLARRRLLHHRVADALLATSRPVATAASVASAVAHHERMAGHDDLAAEQFRRAGDHARSVYANADAASHYDAALALGHPAVAELHEAIGDLETLDGRFVDAVASFERAAARGGPADIARIEGKLGGVHQRRGQWSTAEQHYREALAALGDDGALIERARLTADLAITAHRRGDTGVAAELADQAMELADRAGDDAAQAHAGTVAGLLSAGRDDLDAARGRLTASLERAVRIGDPAAEVAAANGLARVERMAGRLPRARTLLDEALAVCVTIGDRHREAALRDQLAQVLHGLGHHEAAMEELKRAVAIFADIGVEGGSVQTEIWRLSEWVDHSSAGAARNDPGTVAWENVDVSNDAGHRRGP
jgi:DNA-binding SARP family transcriptional activator